MKKLFAISVLSVFIISTLSGCSFDSLARSNSFDPNTSEYINEYALPAGEYLAFLTKQDDIVIQQCVNMLVSSKSMKKSLDNAQIELNTIGLAKATITKAKEAVMGQRPANGYDETRNYVISTYSQILNTLDDYEKMLQNKDVSDIDNITTKLEQLSNSLTSIPCASFDLLNTETGSL